ncbi:YopX family protein [Runella slithyformis]|uniref:YopX protein n=1 Tax=Runella slithyformis (strain ATCC 29530 / DSM 19594 / LMG 11500 / NCIMB 11436 / LSU 4) TaxID=761193 RepID=A0A7U3ZQ35_RUNSL|nr:YopX family protein [Runella slithyformis]AEI51295.1 YopX protein [Runella slithyformis DSM 19594]
MERLLNTGNTFRVWDGKKIHYSSVKPSLEGLPVQLLLNDESSFVLPDSPEFRNNQPVKRFTELKFIGISDRNGEDLYESDIVYYLGEKFVLLWNEPARTYHMYAVNENKLKSEGPVRCSFEEDLVRIGNLFENPDMLTPFRVRFLYTYNRKDKTEQQVA